MSRDNRPGPGSAARALPPTIEPVRDQSLPYIMAPGMSVLMSLRLALKALNRNKLQTALTMLGVVIGVAAVLTMVALGTGAQASIEEKIRAAGTNVITVKAGNYDRYGRDATGPAVEDDDGPGGLAGLPAMGSLAAGGGFSGSQRSGISRDREGRPFWPTPRHRIPPGHGASTDLIAPDGDEIRRRVPGVQYLVATVNDNARLEVGERRHFSPMEGTDVDLPEIRTWTVRRGRFFEPEEVEAAARVAVLGGGAAAKLFDAGEDPVGQEIMLREQPFQVVGVTNVTRTRSPTARPETDIVFVPYTTAQQLLEIEHLHSIVAASESAGETSRVAEDISNLLRIQHAIGPEDPDDFTIVTQAKESILGKGLHPDMARAVVGNVAGLEQVTLEEMAITLQRASRTMTTLLASIAGVSLLVGGIGIMNIMLVSVTERTREIGIRMAVGARARDVLMQFLIEAVTLSLLGGVLGVALGYAASGSITELLQWSTRVSPGAVGLSFGIAAAVGVFFGFYPARQASLLDPIEALRYD